MKPNLTNKQLILLYPTILGLPYLFFYTINSFDMMGKWYSMPTFILLAFLFTGIGYVILNNK